MKIAIATDEGNVSQHFGRCGHYTIVQIDNGQLVNQELIQNPGHEPGFLPEFLSGLGVECVLAGGMGPKAINLFREKGVEPVLGVSGDVGKVISDFIEGRLETGESNCSHGKEDHGHHC